MKKFILASFAALFLLVSVESKADSTKEFIMSCTYGVIAGTLVGAASLAFTSQPGENLNFIARGASLGLYAGIALGAYAVYGVGGGDSQNPDNPEGAPQEEQPQESRWQPLVSPVVSTQGIDGGIFRVSYRF